MSKAIRKIAGLLIVLLVAGCANTSSKQPFFEPPAAAPGKALVYMMRTQVIRGSFYDSVFSINDSAIVGLNDRTYAWVFVTPGVHKISAGQMPHPSNVHLNLKVEEGKQYFVEYTQEYMAELIRVRDATEGKNMVKGYFYVPVK